MLGRWPARICWKAVAGGKFRRVFGVIKVRVGGQKPKLTPRQAATPGDVRRDWHRRQRRYTVAQIAAEFGVTRPTIYRHFISQRYVDNYRLATYGCGMNKNELIAWAQRRLLDRYGTAGERRNPQPPSAGSLIQRVLQAALSPKPQADDTDLRAAMALVAADRWEAESREANLIALARGRGLPWREIALHLGLDSGQAAQQRADRLNRPPATLIYAFRAADEAGAPWHGNPDALPPGEYETATIYFNPAQPRPFSGRLLELRYGPVDEGCEPSYLRAYTTVNNRRVAPTTAVQKELFG